MVTATAYPESALGACLFCHVSDEVCCVLCTISNYTRSVSEGDSLCCSCSDILLSSSAVWDKNTKEEKHLFTVQLNKHTSIVFKHRGQSKNNFKCDQISQFARTQCELFSTQQLNTVEPVGGVQPLACSFSCSSLWLSVLFHDTLSEIRVY